MKNKLRFLLIFCFSIFLIGCTFGKNIKNGSTFENKSNIKKSEEEIEKNPDTKITEESNKNSDVQWGNHDIVWMGAAAGSEACIATVIRTSLRYANLSTIEEGYGINLLPLATFTIDFYGQDDCKAFSPKIENGKDYTDKDLNLMAKMNKAISIVLGYYITVDF